MSYTPSNVPTDPAQLPDFFRRELASISRAISAPVPFLTLVTQNAAPTKLFEGLVAKADGTNWNPGSGAGVYCYRGGSWTFLG